MIRERGRVVVAALSMLALFSLGASGTDSRNASDGDGSASPISTEVTISAGAGRSAFDASTGSCNAPLFHYRTQDAMGYAAVRAQRDRNYLTAEVSHVAQTVTRSYEIAPGSSGAAAASPPGPTDPDAVSSFSLTGGSVRVGHDGDWAGADIGLAAYGQTPNSGLLSTIVFPSSEVRLGPKRHVFLWGDLLAGPATGQGAPVGAGLGHEDERFRARAGITTQGVLLEGSLRLTNGIAIGVENRTQNHLSWSTLLTLRFGRIPPPHPLHHPFVNGVEVPAPGEYPLPPARPMPAPLPPGYEPTGHGPLPFFAADGSVVVISAGDRVRATRRSDGRTFEGTVTALSQRAVLLDTGVLIGADDLGVLTRQ